MYVLCVRFSLDGYTTVTTSDAVQAFLPKNVKDFDPSNVVKCYWQGDERTVGRYYDAQILHMTRTHEEMDAYLSAEKRKCASPVCNRVAVEKQVKTDSFKKRRSRAAVKRQEQLQLLRSMDVLASDASSNSDSSTGGVVPEKQLREKVKELKEARAEIRKLRRLNEDLQAALCCKVLEKDSSWEKICFPQEGVVLVSRVQPLPAAVTPVQDEASSQKKTRLPKQEVGDVPSVQPPLDNMPFIQGSPLPAASPPHPSNTPEFGMEEDDQIHLGEGVTIPTSRWRQLLCFKDSLFCKELAVAIWGSDTLQKRSVSGTLSNRAKSIGLTEAHQQLTPVKRRAVDRAYLHFLTTVKHLSQDAAHPLVKQNVKKYLREKLSDLRRCKL
ncbi:BEN domain-containing protein 5-like [Ornithodoros turicata]|uniref:BEN domain-containing protein 5-like n=1 Tax=Ornithodoros turicata TaxID=34597 RepID=UPI0031396756